MSTEEGLDAAVAEGAGGAATRHLLGQYGQTPRNFATPMRTPALANAGGQDRILAEAQNLARMQNLQTPLLGGQQPVVNPADFSGVTPRHLGVAATPNPMAAAATPSMKPGGPSATPSVAGTPLLGRTGGPGATPSLQFRDQLGLNELDSMALTTSDPRAMRARQTLLKNELRAGLGQLPAPQNEYQIEVPDVPMDEAPEEPTIEEDAADAKARRRREAEAQRVAEERKKSRALQRGLPRPADLEGLPVTQPPAEYAKLGLRDKAEEEVARELVRLLQHDAAKYPAREPRDRRGRKQQQQAPKVAAAPAPPIKDYDESELKAAADLIRHEVHFLQHAYGHSATSADEYMDTWAAAHKDLIFIPSQRKFGRAASATTAEKVDSLRHQLEAARAMMENEAKRAVKLEKKVSLVIAGLQQKNSERREEVDNDWNQVQAAEIELQCFQELHQRELRVAPERIEQLQQLLEGQKEREQQLQERFKMLTREKAQLAATLQAAATDEAAVVGM